MQCHQSEQLTGCLPRKLGSFHPNWPQPMRKSSQGKADDKLNLPAGTRAEKQEWHAPPSCHFKSTYSLCIGGCAGSDIEKKHLEAQGRQVMEVAKDHREPEWEGGSCKEPLCSNLHPSPCCKAGWRPQEIPQAPVSREVIGSGVWRRKLSREDSKESSLTGWTSLKS